MQMCSGYIEQGLTGRTKRECVIGETVEAVFHSAHWLTYTDEVDKRERETAQKEGCYAYYEH